MDFSLKMMGTASAKPVIGRNPSAQVLSVHGRLFLLDCAEGTQMQMLRFGVSPMKIEAVCISHIHGDHVFGIFGLLSTLGLMGRTAPLRLYAPSNFGPILKFFLSYFGEGLLFDIDFEPLSMKAPEVVFSAKSFEILAFPLRHKIDTFGYLFREKQPQYNVRKDVLEKYGFSLTEIGTLKQGGDVVRVNPDGTETVIRNEEAAYLPYSPRSYAYCSDTAPFPELAGWVRGVDLLYHETTYLAELEDMAQKRYHSTTLDAVRCALEAGARRLIIGHYSSRGQDPAQYEAECRRVFPQTFAANDGDVFDVPMEKNM